VSAIAPLLLPVIARKTLGKVVNEEPTESNDFAEAFTMTKNVYTTEQTGKPWKGLQAIGCLGLSTGIVLVFAGTTVLRNGRGGSISEVALSNVAIIGILALLAGFVVQALGRLGGWWFHG
jgi:hypothetical protein